ERLRQETGVLPVMNQIELHPAFNQEAQRKWHVANGVQTQSWSPLGRMAYILEDDNLQLIASHHGKSIAQIVLRWHYQLGSVIIPKSARLERQQENIDIFDFALSEDEMAVISRMTRPDGRQKGQDPAEYEEF